MYSEWESLTEIIQAEPTPNNVLTTFPSNVGKDVVQTVLKPLAEVTGTNSSRTADSVPLTTPEQVHWTMQVIGYGLTLPLTEQHLIASCIDIYDIWLTALYAKKGPVPAPILADPNHYAQIIFEHLSQLFMPRAAEAHAGPSASGSGGLGLHNHAVLCNRALQITHHIIRNANTKFTRETWQVLFKYILKVVDTLLSPPPEPNSLGVTLCSLLIHVLFEAWLCACISCFPSPSLWKTLRELFSNWRHHHYVIEQWNKATYSLTLRVITHLYGPSYLLRIKKFLPNEDKDFKVILDGIPKDVLVQSWFRILHTMGNPVEVSYPSRVLQSQAFQAAVEDYNGSKQKQKNQSPVQICLAELPKIFQEVMHGIAQLIYLFLAEKMPSRVAKKVDPIAHKSTPHGSPSVRKIRDELKSGSRLSTWYVPTVSPIPTGASPVSASQGQSAPGAMGTVNEMGKPRGNTLLHLFGEWLFEAAIWPSEEKELSKQIPSTPDLTHGISHDLVVISDYEEGRAEALGALCSIFTSQQCGEPFLPVYLARFYHALAVGLQYQENASHGQMLTKIILNSRGLLRKDMQSINIVVPHLVKALELILTPKEVSFKCTVDSVELRRCSIDLLLSTLSLPLHFLDQPLPDLSKVIPDLKFPPAFSHKESDFVIIQPDIATDMTDGSPLTFISLKDKLIDVLFRAVESEADPINVQMLLHALMTFMQDMVCYENAVMVMISEESAEDAEVSSINTGHRPLGSTRSDASVQSQVTLAPTVYSTSSLFKHAIRSGNYCLTGMGETNVQVALAALELFGGLAELPVENINRGDCQTAALLLCQFIQHQAMKDRPQHNKDLHTSIVAALSVLLRWINAHPYLLGNKESLTAVMEVIELGVSGTVSSVSQGKTVYKGDKQLKPVSGRVKEMAEFLLFCVMEKSGAFPSPCGVEASSSLLSEEEIILKLPSEKKEEAKFQYFVMDNSIILGLLEGSFPDSDTVPLPTVTAVVRSLTGRHVWSMQLRHNPRSQQVSVEHLQSKQRPFPIAPNPVPQLELERQPWPEQVDQEPSMKIDQSIPVLEDVLDETTLSSHSAIAKLTKHQIEQEVKVHGVASHHRDSVPYPDSTIAIEPSKIQEIVSTARLFLNHVGMLGIESVQEHPDSQQSSLMMLESGPNFLSSLRTLDRLPSRYCNTVFVLYLKEGLSKPEDILLTQKTLADKPSDYIEFLHGLGWIVDPVSHPGFTGRIREAKSGDQARPIGLSAQIPLRPFPYFADAISEVAFIMPTSKPSSSSSATSIRSTESSDSCQETPSLSNPLLSSQSELLSSMQPPVRDPQGSGVSESTVSAEGGAMSTGPNRKLSSKPEAMGNLDTPRNRRGAVSQDCAAIVVWLEKFEDHMSFPLEALSNILHGGALGGSQKTSKKGLPVVFIHMLSSGLFQIVTRNPNSRQDSLAGPLIDGMVVSRRSLSVLTRQTTLNMCQRHRMENEGYYPPHVKRKRKIEEIATSCGLRIPVADFYSRLFSQRDSVRQGSTHIIQ